MSRWSEQAACSDLTPYDADRLFFGEHVSTRAQRDRAVAERKEMCGGCPVRQDCSVAGAKSLGSWGGSRVKVLRGSRTGARDVA